MKVAVLSESSADEPAIRILVNGILNRETEAIINPPLRSRGWPSVIKVLPMVIKHLHYQTDTDALVVVADSDDSPVHQPIHDEAGKGDSLCRLCQLRNVVNLEKSRLRHVPRRNVLNIAIGLAVPAIEAWYCCGVDAQVNESVWYRKLQSESIAYTRNSLKIAVYGTDRPSIELETLHAQEAASRLVNEIPLLEQLFPNGFGLFAREIRNWQIPQSGSE